MSYEIVKSITIKGDKIEVTSACNNCRPLYYSKWEFVPYYNKNADLREKLFALFKDILDGNLHLQQSVNTRIKNAMMVSPCMALSRNEKYESCYSKADRLYLEKVNKYCKINREDFEKDWDYECAITRKADELLTKEDRDKMYVEAQHEAYDNAINPMIEAYLTNSVDRDKWVVKFNGCCYLTKMNYNTYRYTSNKERAKLYDLYDAYHNSQYITNSTVERA